MSKPRSRPQTPFTRILNQLLEDKGLTVREAAELAGVGPSTVMSWKSGALPENYVAVKRLAHALGTTLSFLLTGEQDTKDPKALPVIAEVFDDAGPMFDGYARIIIHRLIPRAKNEGTKT